MTFQARRCAGREAAWYLSGIIARRREGSRTYPAFFDRAGARTGFSAFFGCCTFASSLAARLPLIGSSISRWPSTRLPGFLPLAFAAGADCFSLARLRFKASIRLMTLPLDFGPAFAGKRTPLRFLLIRSISADS